MANATWKYCTTALTPNQQPTNLEIFLPPSLMILAFIIGLGLIYISTVLRKKKTVYEHKEPLDIPKKGFSEKSAECWRILEDNRFLCDFDHEALACLKKSGYGFYDLLVMTLPALCSVGLSCIMLLAYEPIVHCFWPRRARSSSTMNAAISCFVIPAGFVYALSFGFMFQFAMEKFGTVVNKVTSEISLIDQLVTMTTKMKLPSARHTMALLKAIKAECMCIVVMVQNKTISQFKNKPPRGMQVAIWHILDIVRDANKEKESGYAVNSLITSKIVKYAVQLNNITTDRMGSLHDRIHVFTWFFLECLGCTTLFAMMLVFASSFKMELAICHLTLLSVSMLCYILSDFDAPFSGFFHIDLTALPDVIKRIERLYDSAQHGRPLDITYDRERDRVLQVVPNA